MAKGKLILICQFGGDVVKNEDGMWSCSGGDANALHIFNDTLFSDLKLKLAEICNMEQNSVTIKYILPGYRQVLINLCNDDDLKSMFAFYSNLVTADVFVFGKEGYNHNAIKSDINRTSRIQLAETVGHIPVPTMLVDSTSLSTINIVSSATVDDHENPSHIDYITEHPKEITPSPAPDTVKRRKRCAAGKVGAADDTAPNVDSKTTKRRKSQYGAPIVADNVEDQRISVGEEKEDDNKKLLAAWKTGIDGPGQEFNSAHEFRDALQKYAIAHRFTYKFKKNDDYRVNVKCAAEGCSWKIHAAWVPPAQLFWIKKMNKTHTCEGESWKSANFAKNWLVSLITKKLHDAPYCKPKDLADDIAREFGLKLTYAQVRRWVKDAKEQLTDSKEDAHNELMDPKEDAHNERMDSRVDAHDELVNSKEDNHDELMDMKEDAHVELMDFKGDAHEELKNEKGHAYNELMDSKEDAHNELMDSKEDAHEEQMVSKEDAHADQMVSKEDAHEELLLLSSKIVKMNPESIVILSKSNDGRLQRLFLSFNATIHGFQRGCRPLLFLDCTSIMSDHKEFLLVASALDGNDCFFPIAIAFVYDENDDNWLWFLDQLKASFSTTATITFISDQEKCLLELVSRVFVNAEQGYSIHHLVDSFVKNFKGPNDGSLLDSLMAAVLANDVTLFKSSMELIKEVSPSTYVWLCKIDPKYWANSLFKGERHNHITENSIKALIELLERTRELPISQKLEAIIQMMENLMNTRRTESREWNSKLTPSKEGWLAEATVKASNSQVISSSESVFEVWDGTVNIVDIKTRECSCRGWWATGMPCLHAISVLNHTCQNVYNFCSKYFTVESFKLTYSKSINPLSSKPDDDEEDDEDEDEDEDEEENPEDDEFVLPPRTPQPVIQGKKKERKRRTTYERLCSICRRPGHNKVTCKAEM